MLFRSMFEPYYSENRWQNSKLYFYKNGKCEYVSDNATTVYATGGVFYGDKIYNVKSHVIEMFAIKKNSVKLQKSIKTSMSDEYQFREVRVNKNGIYAIASDSIYIKEGTGKRWNTQLFFLKK